jgi:hypothetical protein
VSKWRYKSEPIKLKFGYTVEFSLKVQGKVAEINCEWDPCVPSPLELNSMKDEYRAARDSFLSSLDVPTLVVET